MVKTNGERAKIYRAKKNSLGDVPFQVKNKEKCKRYREHSSDKAKERVRNLCRIRVQTFRVRAKHAASLIAEAGDNSSSVSIESPFRSRQAYGKALKRVKVGLPYSPRKKAAVVTQIATEIGLRVVSPINRNILRPRLTYDTKNCVTNYYLRDDISRAHPGKRDVITLRSGGIKKKVPKRTLMFNLKEVYMLFRREHENIQIGVSKFCELRPKQVKLVNSKSQLVCCCPYCENIQLAFNSVTWSTEEDHNPKNLSELVTLVVCNPLLPECMKRRCNKCRISTDINSYIFDSIDDDRESIPVRQWKKGVLEQEVFTKSEVSEMISTQLNKYIPHIYDVKVQAKFLSEEKANIKEGVVILQLDFAENYAIRHQNEVMAAHWQPSTGQSVTIFTAVAYYKETGESPLKYQTYAVISDTPNHSSLEVQVFCNKIFDSLSEKIAITDVSIWTDGAGSHFKNRSTMAALSFFPEIHGFPAVWNFSESYHGKGAHDGVGGLLKYQVWRKVLQGRTVVRRSLDFYECAKSFAEDTCIIHVPVAEIDLNKPRYEKIWNNCKAASSIQQARCIKPIGRYRLNMYRNSNDSDPFVHCNIEPISGKDDISEEESVDSVDDASSVSTFSSDDLQELEESDNEGATPPTPISATVGDFVMVKYCTRKVLQNFVGNIESVSDSVMKIKYLRRIGVNRENNLQFQYPAVEDIDDKVTEDMIVQHLPQPQLHRMTFTWSGVTFSEPTY